MRMTFAPLFKTFVIRTSEFRQRRALLAWREYVDHKKARDAAVLVMQQRSQRQTLHTAFLE
jgi:hypothetical protein